LAQRLVYLLLHHEKKMKNPNNILPNTALQPLNRDDFFFGIAALCLTALVIAGIIFLERGGILLLWLAFIVGLPVWRRFRNK
jgi:hypothetical protein